MKRPKFIIGVVLVVQALTFIGLFFVLYGKKKSLAKTLVALATAGGITGALLLASNARDERHRRNIMAMDACCDFDDDFDYYEDDDAFTDETVSIPPRDEE
ncbi:MAG: hypothetical protein AB9835_07745 [Eubacteriales bacterium]